MDEDDYDDYYGEDNYTIYAYEYKGQDDYTKNSSIRNETRRLIHSRTTGPLHGDYLIDFSVVRFYFTCLLIN